MKTCNGIHLYEFEQWIIDKKNNLAKVDDKNKTVEQLAESEFLWEVLVEISEFLRD